ncbi:MAG: hypothetical protein LBH49_04095, partial [Puniceicoccales bacterium]|nr:hypothetical protein [Puniceicoccales bacterium]
MQKFIGAVSIVCGTAIGAGLIALPLALAKVGIAITEVLILVNLLVAYRTSCVMIDINHHLSKGTSIVECSKILSGDWMRMLAMASFFALSFSLLAVYIACTADIISAAFGQKSSTMIVILCGTVFCILFSLKVKLLSNLNSIFFILLILSIFTVLFKVFIKSFSMPFFSDISNGNHIFSALPILFTSFGVQNVCPHVYDFLDKNHEKTKRAFLVGIIFTAIIYMSWIYVVLTSI